MPTARPAPLSSTRACGSPPPGCATSGLALDAPDVVLAQDRIDILHGELARLAPTDADRRILAPRLGRCVAAVERARGALRTNATEPLLLDALMIEVAGLLRHDPVLA